MAIKGCQIETNFGHVFKNVANSGLVLCVCAWFWARKCDQIRPQLCNLFWQWERPHMPEIFDFSGQNFWKILPSPSSSFPSFSSFLSPPSCFLLLLLPSQSCPLSPSSFLLSCSSFLFSFFCLLLLFRSFKCDALILPSVLKIVTKIGLEKRDWKETCLRDHFWTKIFISTVCDGRFACFFDFKTWPKSASLPNPTKRSLQNQWWRTKRIRFRNS